MVRSRNTIVKVRPAKHVGKGVGRMVRNAIRSNAERKTVNAQSNANASTTGGAIFALSQQLISGTGFNQRIGSAVSPIGTWLDVRVATILNSGATRFILFQDKMNTGSVPAVLDVLDTANYFSPYSGITEIESRRFKVLEDVVLDVSVTGEQSLTRRKRISNVLRKLEFLGSTNTSSANGYGAMFLLVISSTTGLTFDYYWRLDYTDN